MVIHRSFSPEELWRDMKVTPVRHAVFVQVFNNEQLEETSKITVKFLSLWIDRLEQTLLTRATLFTIMSASG